MTSHINQVLRRLKVEFALLWLLPLLTAACYETEGLPQGIFVDHVQASYCLNTLGILLTIVCIPLSLRLFQLSLTRYVRQLPVLQALRSYRRWNEVRICLLLVPVLLNLSVYYWTLESTGLLCCGMTLTASLFCLPSRQRMENELALPAANDDLDTTETRPS